MSDIQWFPFDIQAFVADTMRLHTHAKGAYLMLLIDYYQHGKGCPADNDTMRVVAGMSQQEWDAVKAPVTALFKVCHGLLQHDRADLEIKKIREQREKKVRAGNASAKKRWNYNGPVTDVIIPLQQNGNGAVAEGLAEQQQEPYQEVNSEVTNNNNNNSIKKESSLRELKKAPAILDRPMPNDFALNPEDLSRCLNDGADPPWVWNVFENWKHTMIETGALHPDWKAAWWRRWERSKPKDPVKAKPRLVVSVGSDKKATTKTPLPDDWMPNSANAAICATEGYDLDEIAQHFRDVCAANGYRYIDHHKAFSNFIRNQKNFTRGGYHGKTATRGSIVEAGNAAIRNLDERIAAARAAETGHEGRNPPVPELPED